jgi:putative hydrolase of the HAD superfamily
MTMRAVIFDFGGVLGRGTEVSRQRAWEERLGLAPGGLGVEVWQSPVATWARVGRAQPEEVWAYLCERFGLGAQEVADLHRDLFSGEQVDEELVAFLHSLRPRYKTAILSNCWPGARTVMEERYGLNGVVDELILSYEVGIAKPDLRIFALAADRLGVRPQETVFVDDVAPNVTAAHAAGMTSVRFESTEQTIAAVRAALADAPSPDPGPHSSA